MDLDRDKLLAGDPATTIWCLMIARRWVLKSFSKPSVVDGLTQSAMADAIARLRAKKETDRDRVAWVVLGCANNVVRRELTRIKNEVSETFDSQVHTPDGNEPSDVIQLRRKLEQVNAALLRCDERTRLILLARASGASYEEICSEYGGEVEATRAFVRRERRKLRAELDAEDHRQLFLNEVKRLGLGPHVQAACARSASADP